jgi:hypothetical protein
VVEGTNLPKPVAKYLVVVKKKSGGVEQLRQHERDRRLVLGAVLVASTPGAGGAWMVRYRRYKTVL